MMLRPRRGTKSYVRRAFEYLWGQCEQSDARKKYYKTRILLSHHGQRLVGLCSQMPKVPNACKLGPSTYCALPFDDDTLALIYKEKEEDLKIKYRKASS